MQILIKNLYLTNYQAGSLSSVETSPKVDPSPKVDQNATRFDVRGSSSVVDAKTGLMWSSDDLSVDRMTHTDALEAVAAYRGDGYSDWRLPTREELLSLVDDTRTGPAIDTSVFPTCKRGSYWTSTPRATDKCIYAWVVNFTSGDSFGLARAYECRVRAVRNTY